MMSNKKLKINVDKAIDEFKRKLLKKFKSNLISVILFGSRAKKPRWDSDLDLLVVIKGIPANWRKRDRIFSDLEYEISVKHGVPISAIYYSPKEIEFAIKVKDKLMLGVLLGYRVIYDKEKFFEKNIKKLQELLDKESASYIPEEKVWLIPSLRLG